MLIVHVRERERVGAAATVCVDEPAHAERAVVRRQPVERLGQCHDGRHVKEPDAVALVKEIPLNLRGSDRIGARAVRQTEAREGDDG